MTANQTSIVAQLVEVVASGLETSPQVLYADPSLEPTIDLLPSHWPRKLVDRVHFAAEVNSSLTDRPVFGLPPWGRRPESKVPWEVEAIAGLTPPGSDWPLILLLPAGIFLSQGAGQQCRTLLMEKWNIDLVAYVGGGILGAQASLRSAVTVISNSVRDHHVLRMFEVPRSVSGDDESVLADLRRILRMKGGKTEFGYVLRDRPPAGAPLVFEQFHPDVIRRRAELPDYGRMAQLDDLFEVFQSDPRLSASTANTRAGTGARKTRVISGRAIRTDHTITPPDDGEKCWTSEVRGELAAGDILVSAIRPAFWVRPGLPWARVREHDLPAVPGERVIVLRPRPDVATTDVDFVTRYLSSRDLLELSDDPRLHRGTMTLTASTLGAIRIPLPDEHLAEALRSVEAARARAAEWAAEADEILDVLFDAGGANLSRQRVIERSRSVRLRMTAVDDIDTLSGQVRTQYPLPIAYAWRSLEALTTQGPSRQAYLAALDAGEQALAFAANVGLALAHESGQSVSALRQIAERLLRRQGPTLSDWSNVLDELAHNRFDRLDGLISSTEFRDFCRNTDVASARTNLRNRRNDEAHQRRVDPMRLAEALDELHGNLQVILTSLSFFLDNSLIVARELHWDSILETGKLKYHRLAGDHPIVPHKEMDVATPEIEAGSLYLLDSANKLHLLRPFLIGTHCSQCGTFSVFHIDRFIDNALTMKSMEHGHTIGSSPELVEAAREVGLLLRDK